MACRRQPPPTAAAAIDPAERELRGGESMPLRSAPASSSATTANARDSSRKMEAKPTYVYSSPPGVLVGMVLSMGVGWAMRSLVSVFLIQSYRWRARTRS
jgi:hypothetical protein